MVLVEKERKHENFRNHNDRQISDKRWENEMKCAAATAAFGWLKEGKIGNHSWEYKSSERF